MKDPFKIAIDTSKVLELVKSKDLSPSAGSNAYTWLNTVNVLTGGVTPLIYIEEGYGDKLIAMLLEKV